MIELVSFTNWGLIFLTCFFTHDSSTLDETKIDNCYVMFYNHGIPRKCPRKADRQTPVLKWIVKDIYCTLDEPLEVNQQQFEVILKSFKNFLLLLTSSTIKTSRQLVNQFKKQNELCGKTNNILLISSEDDNVIKNLELPRRPPMLLHIVHGLYIIFDGNLADMNVILEWISVKVPTNLRFENIFFYFHCLNCF